MSLCACCKVIESRINLMMLCLFIDQPWRNVFGGNSPLKNSSPVNVSRFSIFLIHKIAHARCKHIMEAHSAQCVINSCLCPQMDCVPSQPFWCLSSARRTLRSTLPVRITGIPNPPQNYQPKPRRSLMSSSAAMLHER